MADTPAVKTTFANRRDLQELIPDNVRLRRAMEDMFNDVGVVLPTAVGQNTTEIAQALSSAELALSLPFSTAEYEASVRRLKTRLEDLERMVFTLQAPVKPRVEQFIAPTLLNSWVNNGAGFNNAGFYKDPFGIVHLRGMIKSGTIGTAAFTLPLLYRPQAEEVFSVVSNGAFGQVNVQTGGNVVITVGNNTFVSLDGITFRAA